MPTQIDSSKCKNHLVCVEVCPEGVYEEKDGKPVIAHPDNCTEIYSGIA
ncbi:MAG: ferredoxin family protein [Promethearchaeota archaeon]